MEKTYNKEIYKILYGLLKKLNSYNCKWKNFIEYTAKYFRCLKYLKYEIGLLKLDQTSELFELQKEELIANSNNIDKKVTNTLELFFKQEQIISENKKLVLDLLSQAKKLSENYMTNTNTEDYEKYGFKTLVNNKVK